MLGLRVPLLASAHGAYAHVTMLITMIPAIHKLKDLAEHKTEE